MKPRYNACISNDKKAIIVDLDINSMQSTNWWVKLIIPSNNIKKQVPIVNNEFWEFLDLEEFEKNIF